MLFLDHWEKFYVPDLRLCEELSLLKPGSVIVADNTDMPGAPDYLKYVEGGGEGGWKYRCESIEVGGSTKGPVSLYSKNDLRKLMYDRALCILHIAKQHLDDHIIPVDEGDEMNVN